MLLQIRLALADVPLPLRIHPQMAKKNLTAADYYRLATAYRERTHIAVNTDDLEARDYAAHLATQAYMDCMDLVQKTSGYGVDSWRELGPQSEILSSYYYLAMLLSERGGGNPPEDMWSRLVTVHSSARYYIDFIWTLCLYQIPGLEHHLHIITTALPTGYNSRFDLTVLTEGRTSPELKELINNILLECSSKRKFGSKDGVVQQLPELNSSLDARDPRKLLELANKAIAGLIDCVEEISLYMCSIAKNGGSEVEQTQGYIQLSQVPCPNVITGGQKCPPLDASSAQATDAPIPIGLASNEGNPVVSNEPHVGYNPPPGQHGYSTQYQM